MLCAGESTRVGNANGRDDFDERVCSKSEERYRLIIQAEPHGNGTLGKVVHDRAKRQVPRRLPESWLVK